VNKIPKASSPTHVKQTTWISLSNKWNAYQIYEVRRTKQFSNNAPGRRNSKLLWLYLTRISHQISRKGAAAQRAKSRTEISEQSSKMPC